ncbi:hypothetical protein [Aestuariivirga sp.]|uniref:hypothetical protein n=1 Tax=Aestuariivirga sp. TaxID=2650926 RepID=UPI0039E29ACD
METLLPLILQIVAGGVGGTVGGAAVKTTDMGTLLNAITGAVGGVGAGQLLPILLGAASSAGFDIGNVAASGVGGIVLQVIAGLIRSKMKQSA